MGVTSHASWSCVTPHADQTGFPYSVFSHDGQDCDAVSRVRSRVFSVFSHDGQNFDGPWSTHCTPTRAAGNWTCTSRAALDLGAARCRARGQLHRHRVQPSTVRAGHLTVPQLPTDMVKVPHAPRPTPLARGGLCALPHALSLRGRLVCSQGASRRLGSCVPNAHRYSGLRGHAGRHVSD